MPILPISPDAPLLVRAAAETVLVAHIAGGTGGIISGTVALLSRKGERLHRAAGTVFFVSMLVMSGIGAVVAPFFPDRVSAMAGAFTFYLVLTGWITVRRQEGRIGVFEKTAFAFALAIAATDFELWRMAMATPSHTLDDSPPQAFYVIGLLVALAATTDLKVILRGGISGAQRIARHLWRLSAALFIAAGSFFLGQQPVMPKFIQGSPLLFVPEIAIIALLLFWLVRVRLTKWYARGSTAPMVAAE
ncbi:MAG TPA: hypothetical protein VGG48_16765 [Rhizomicrobium sp.]|jgi:uncharacterized membrane protein